MEEKWKESIIPKGMKKFLRYSNRLKKKQIEAVGKLPLFKKILPFNWIGFKRFERIVRINPPYDKRNKNPKKNYGISALSFFFILKGRKGAVQIYLSTQYYPSKIMDGYIQKKGYNPFRWTYNNELKDTFDCWDIGYHSIKKPDYLEKDDKRVCDINDCGYCYYDGSSLRGEEDKIGELFMDKGEEGIWEYLENYYKETFNDKKPSGFGLLVKLLPFALAKKKDKKEKEK